MAMRQVKTFDTYRRNYDYEGTIYEATISVKSIRARLRLRLNQAKHRLSISVCPGVDLTEIDKFVIESLPKLVKRFEKRTKTDSIDKNSIYLLGEKRTLEEGETLESVLRGKKKSIVEYFTKRVRYYEKLMGVKSPYKVRGTYMKTLYGSNSSKTHSINLSLLLFCYTEDCIDSVVVHELAHDVHRNHGKNFYRKVLKYFPNYSVCRKRLIYHIYNPSLLGDSQIDNSPMEESDNE